jgi:hypothetical protein
MDSTPNEPSEEWAVPDDAGFQQVKARFKENRKKKRRRTLLVILLVSLLAWIPIIISLVASSDQPKYLSFNNDRLDIVFARIEHLYGIHINIADEQLKGRQFSGTFRQQQPEKVLGVLSRSLEFTYTQAGTNHYVIERK